MSEKIQKLLSHFGFSSRRSIEKMIKNNSIFVNDKQVTIGQRIDPCKIKKIVINGQVISLKNTPFQTKVIIYNKPEGEICTRNDTYNRITVFDKLPLLNMYRWINIGRLDINTRGLLLFTNNGNLANTLMHPKNVVEREYYMRVFGDIDHKTINILKNGVKIKNGYAAFKSIESIQNITTGRNKWFKAILCEGKNREIRYMWKKVQCQVNRLIRIRYGNVILPKTLKLGNWMELNATLVKNLCNLVSFKEKLQ